MHNTPAIRWQRISLFSVVTEQQSNSGNVKKTFCCNTVRFERKLKRTISNFQLMQYPLLIHQFPFQCSQIIPCIQFSAGKLNIHSAKISDDLLFVQRTTTTTTTISGWTSNEQKNCMSMCAKSGEASECSKPTWPITTECWTFMSQFNCTSILNAPFCVDLSILH